MPSCQVAIDGDELLVLPVGEFVVGVVTCYDLRFPELFRVLANRGVTVFAVPAAWVSGPLKHEHWMTMCRARAIENTSYLLAAAQTPPRYCGRSLVLDPMGVELAGLGEIDGVATAEISPTRVTSVRAALPVLLQRRYEVRPRAVTAQATGGESLLMPIGRDRLSNWSTAFARGKEDVAPGHTYRQRPCRGCSSQTVFDTLTAGQRARERAAERVAGGHRVNDRDRQARHDKHAVVVDIDSTVGPQRHHDRSTATARAVRGPPRSPRLRSLTFI